MGSPSPGLRPSPRPVPASPTSRALVAAVVAGTSVFLGLLLAVTLSGLAPLSVDADVLRTVLADRSAGTTTLARTVTRLGASSVVLPVLLAAAAWTAYRRRSPAWLVVTLLAVGAGVLVRYGISVAVARPRPPLADRTSTASGFAFPSGHTTTATLVWLVVSYLLLVAARGDGRRRTAVHVAVPVVVALVVAWSRVWLAVHWFTDVLAGLGLGTALAALVVLLLRRLP